MSFPSSRFRVFRRFMGQFTLTALLLTAMFQAAWLVPALPLEDFPEYWAAGHLVLHGENPYDYEAMSRVQRRYAMVDAGAIMMWNPPWSLPLVMPLGLLSPGTGRLLWMLLHMGALALSLSLLWQYYGGPAGDVWLAWMLGLGFVPTLLALEFGQIVPFVVLGIAGFLHLQRRGADGAAGAALVLAAVKPHLVLLFGAAVLLWAVHRWRWRLLLGGMGTGLAATGLVLAFDPAVVQQYVDSLRQHPPALETAPTVGRILADLGIDTQPGVYFVPTLFGLLWLLIHYRRRRADWDWAAQAPLLLVVSVIVSAYGAWSFDLVVVAVPVVQLAAAGRALGWQPATRWALTFFVLTNVYMGLVSVMVRRLYCPPWYWLWLPATYLLAYLALRRELHLRPGAAVVNRRPLDSGV